MDALFIAAVEAIYVAASDPSLWPAALQAIADVFGDVGTVMIYARDDGGFGAISSASLAPLLSDYAQNFAGQDLRAIRGRERGYFLNRDAITDSDFISPQEMETHPYYKMLERHGVRYCAAVPVQPERRVEVAISVQRAIDKAPYSENELALLRRLGGHAEKSLRLSTRLLDAELANVGFGEALARIGIGVFALDSLKRVVFANPAAQRLTGDGLAIVNDRILVAAPAERAALEAAIDRMIRGAPEDLAHEPKPILIHRREAERPLAVYVLPIAAASAATAQFLTQTRAIVLAIDPQANEPADPAIVRDVLGLTLGEARVASLVGSGLPPREAAQKLGITEETARTALKRVFGKVGISRQSELAALLTRLVLR
jgi:DNA-binding CsgD family transcriptional regulator